MNQNVRIRDRHFSCAIEQGAEELNTVFHKIILIGRFPANQRCCMDKVVFFSQSFQMIFEASDVGRNINVLIMKNESYNVFVIMGFTITERAGFIDEDTQNLIRQILSLQ